MNIKELKLKFNLPISSGDGKSIDNPIVIEKKESKNYVKLEYFIISHLIEMDDNFDYERCNQKLLKYNNKTIDYLKIRIKNKKSSDIQFEEFYFDITKVY